MEVPLALLGGGGGGSGGSYGSSTTKESTLSNAEAMSAEESAYRAEAELELGLGLSLGGGSSWKVKANAWGERGRILTAQDFPAVVCHGGSSSPSRFLAKASGSAVGAVSGTKRAAADSVPQEGGSPTAVSQVVGWPPIRAYRMNSLVNQAKTPRTEEEEKETGEKDRSKDALMKKVSDNDKTNNSTIKEKVHLGFVKVNMDGVVIGRKVDLNAHSCYETLALMLEDMFLKPTGSANPTGTGGDKDHQATKVSKLLDGSSEFVLTYEDREGDWMLVGDVPWRMFRSSVKKLRIMRTSEANGLAPRCQERIERQRSKLI